MDRHDGGRHVRVDERLGRVDDDRDWDAPHVLLLWAMWAVMMTAMMLPSAAPLLLLYAGALRGRDAPARPAGLRDGRGIRARVGRFSIAATVCSARSPPRSC
jgi:hypothetical protein